MVTKRYVTCLLIVFFSFLSGILKKYIKSNAVTCQLHSISRYPTTDPTPAQHEYIYYLLICFVFFLLLLSLYTAMDPNNSQLYVQSNKEQSNSSTGTTRKRTRATPEQLTILEKTFAINPSPNSRIREQLARELAMSERSIQIWFQNRRAKVKNVAKKSSMLRDETLRMQYYASNAAIAACKAAMYQQQQQTEGHQTIESNPDLYYYYYYYYFNQQQQSRNYNMPPPPPPPQHRPFTTTTASPKMTNDTLWSKKQMYQQRARAHTIGPSSINFNIGPQQDTTFTNLLNNTTMSPTPFEQQEFLPYSSASPSLFEQQTLWSSEIPFCNIGSTCEITL